ncbi:tyrosine-type recombinase/integrase [Enterococcus sp. AZ196]|uniref:tyrosine-type recombinase/integrase n=1 Tax=Enterococcus sp. AZ196 TaxID=2774659 RepID=UPI003D29F188
MNEQVRKGENIYYRKDGRWEGRYAIGRKSDGRLRYGYVYARSYQIVREKLYPLKQRAERMLQLYGKSLMSYDEWIVSWKKSIQTTVKASTFSDYCYKLRHYILPYVGESPLYQLTSEKIQELVNQLCDASLSPNSIQIIICLMKKTLNDAKKLGLIAENPCDTVQLPKRAVKKIHALTVDEQQTLMEAVETIGSDKGQAVTLALNTGMRIGEISALTWDKVDFNRGMIYVDQTCQRLTNEEEHQTVVHYDSVKSASSNRIIPMNQKVKRVLKRIKEKSTSDYVFSIKEKGCEPRLLTYYFHKIRKKAKLENIHFHQLRHTFATRCLDAKVGITSVSALLGHASTKMTLDVYSDSMLEERITAVYAIEGLIKQT